MSTMSRLDHIGLLLAPKTMLWRKYGPQLTGKFLRQQIEGQTNVCIYRRAIHDDGETTPDKQMLLIRQQSFETDAK